MTLRLFKCAECGHRMRVARRYCGRCHGDKAGAQQPALLLSSAAVIFASAVVWTVV